MDNKTFATAVTKFFYYANNWGPSANEYRPGKGILLGIDLATGLECLIIGHMGHRIALFYEYVNYPKTKTSR